MKKSASSAEKRALWAIRRQHGIDTPLTRGKSRASREKLNNSLNQSHQHASSSTSIPNKSRHLKPAHRTRSWILRTVIILVLVIVISSGVFGYRILAAGDTISTANRSILGQLKDLLFRQGNLLDGEQDDRINILLIAIGGKGHKGEDLADTIMIASIQPSNNTAALLSIPRDLYVQVPGEEYFTKINAVHSYGELKGQNQGPELLRDLGEEITGLPLHYYVRVDFTAFKNIVDAVGGVNVTNEKTFYDYWHKISFPAGTEQMNGERALAFVRARYIEGSEGGDFKRAARQQQLLLALREKVFSYQTALDFTRINAILNSLSDNIRTDMHLWEMRRFYEISRATNPDRVYSLVLDSSPTGVLVGDTEILGGTPASVLRPRTGDYSEIQRLAQNILTDVPDSTSPAITPTGKPVQPPPTEADNQATVEPTPTAAKLFIEIRNGTTITGLAKRTSEKLTSQDYVVVAVGNAVNQATSTTTVYTLDQDLAKETRKIADLLDANTDAGLPSEEPASQAQILIILGADSE